MPTKRKRVWVPVREQLYEQIRELILNNTYEPGRIVQIEKLADEFGVSTTPIREALIRLEGAGLLQMIPNKGVQISGIREQDIRNTWEMRRVLEPYAGGLAAKLPLDDEIEQITRKLNAFLAGAFDFEIYTRTDIQIHELFYTHIENTLLRETIQRVHQMSMRMRYFAENVSHSFDSFVDEVTREHLAIMEAMRSHDSKHTATAIAKHLENGEKRTLETFFAKQDGETVEQNVAPQSSYEP